MLSSHPTVNESNLKVLFSDETLALCGRSFPKTAAVVCFHFEVSLLLNLFISFLSLIHRTNMF